MEKNPNATKIAETTGGGASYFITEGVLGWEDSKVKKLPPEAKKYNFRLLVNMHTVLVPLGKTDWAGMRSRRYWYHFFNVCKVNANIGAFVAAG
jgi:hypothetical protein